MATAFSVDSFSKAEPIHRVRAVEGGLPAAALRDVLAGGAITIADLVGIVASRRTLDRRLADDARLSLAESDRLARFIEVLGLATYLFGNRANAMEWLKAPQFYFDGTPPIELMRTHDGNQMVLTLMNQSRHGILP